jgi:hypothetical protein
MEPDFDEPSLALRGEDELAGVQLPDATRTIDFVDKTWYRDVVKRARWMDLIGDYAGTERFIVDGAYSGFGGGCGGADCGDDVGEAVLQEVLDDPLLAIGREDGESSRGFLKGLHAI